MYYFWQAGLFKIAYAQFLAREVRENIVSVFIPSWGQVLFINM